MSENVIKEFYSTVTGQHVSIINVDDFGVPIVDYGGDIGNQRNPVTTSQKAFFYEEKYRETNNETYKQLFLNCAEWLVDNAIEYGNYTVWEYNFPWKKYNMTPPWRSGIAQGQGIQALTKAYNLTGNEKYLKVARTSLNVFYVEVKNGGVTYKESDGGWWYEEYADENGSNPRVLNGMIFALLGIHEYYEQTGDEDAKYLFDKGIIAVKKHLSDYSTRACMYYNLSDGGVSECTYYDVLGNPASLSYHNIHVDQMSKLYNITGDPIFKEYYDKWKNYKYVGNKERSYRLKLAIFILNFSLLFILLETVVFLIGKNRERKN